MDTFTLIVQSTLNKTTVHQHTGLERDYLKGGFTLKSKNGTFLLNTAAGCVCLFCPCENDLNLNNSVDGS